MLYSQINEIAKILKSARKLKKMSQCELAKSVGLPQSHISNIENGKIDLRLTNFFEIARILGLEPMLVPKYYQPAIEAIIKGQPTNIPKYTIDGEDDEGDENGY